MPATPADGPTAAEGRTSRLTRIWADDAGISHFADDLLPVTVHPSEVGVPELWVAEGLPVEALHLVTVRDGTLVPHLHTAPRRQIVVFLTGWARIEVGDGEERTFPAGSAVFVTDTHGTGHTTTHEPGDQRVLVVPAADPHPDPRADRT